MLPFVDDARGRCRNRTSSARAAPPASSGKANDPYYLYQDPNKPIKLDDLTLRAGGAAGAPEGPRRRCCKGINGSMPEMEKAVQRLRAGRILREGVRPGALRQGARGVRPRRRRPDKVRDRYGRTRSARALLLARRLIEAGTRFVQVNWPAVANGDPERRRLGHARRQFRPAEESALPEARQRPVGADRGHGPARHAQGHAAWSPSANSAAARGWA